MADNKSFDDLLAETRGRYPNRHVSRKAPATLNRVNATKGSSGAMGRHREDPLRAHPRTLDAIGIVQVASLNALGTHVKLRVEASGVQLVLDSHHPAAPYETNLVDGADLVGRRVHVSGVPVSVDGDVVTLSSATVVAVDPIGADIVTFDVLEWDGDCAICGAVMFRDLTPDCVSASILRAIIVDGEILMRP